MPRSRQDMQGRGQRPGALDRDITLQEALTGFSFNVTHLDDRVLQVSLALFSAAFAWQNK